MHDTDTNRNQGASAAATWPPIKRSGPACDRDGTTEVNTRAAARERVEAARERVEIRRELRAAGLL
jgi:hypothetical protein